MISHIDGLLWPIIVSKRRFYASAKLLVLSPAETVMS